METKTDAVNKPVIREVVLTRLIGAPRELVYEVWTDPKHVARWYGPRLFTIPNCEIDLRPGGRRDIDMRGPDGNLYPDKSVFLEVVPPERLVFLSKAFEDEDGNAPFEVRNTVTFEDFNGMTKMILRAEVLKATPEMLGAVEGMEQGWSESFYKLADLLDVLQSEA